MRLEFKKEFFTWSLLAKVAAGIGFALLAFILARLTFYGLREPYRPAPTIAIALCLMIFIPSRKTFWCIVFPLSLIVGIYTPIAHIYGLPDYQALVSLLGTDKAEATEFMGLISTKLYLLGLSIPLLAVITHFIARYSGLRLWRNKVFVLIIIAYLVILLNPISFFDKAVDTLKNYYEVSKCSEESTWTQSKTSSVPKDYILLVGESARRDYFHVYGYPVDNTPFLDNVTGTIVNGLSAGGFYTATSLSNMLTAGKNWVPRYDRSVIDLAKSAGIETIWITNNQTETIGKWETPITALAAKADRTIRVDSGKSDFALLDNLKDVLKEETTGIRLIILHTKGSHYDACKKVSNMKDKYTVTNSYYDYIACYVSSIKLTDQFIEQTYDTLEQHRATTNRPFSIIYFSDHGQKITTRDGKMILYHSEKDGSFLYDIPLVKIDSQNLERKDYKSRKSGLRFTEGLAHWMEITNPDIKDYDLFDGKDDPNDFGLAKMIQKFKSPPDPAIDITPMLKK